MSFFFTVREARSSEIYEIYEIVSICDCQQVNGEFALVEGKKLLSRLEIVADHFFSFFDVSAADLVSSSF